MPQKAIHRSGENVLVDLGFEDAQELSAKTILAIKLNELIDKRGLNQTDVAALTGMTLPKVSQIRRYKLQSTSLGCLMQALAAFDQHIEIIVRPAADMSDPAGISVAT